MVSSDAVSGERARGSGGIFEIQNLNAGALYTNESAIAREEVIDKMGSGLHTDPDPPCSSIVGLRTLGPKCGVGQIVKNCKCGLAGLDGP